MTNDTADVERIYDLNAKSQTLERVPYVMASAVNSIIDQANADQATQLRNFDPHKVVDNSTIERLVKEGFFEKLFGNSVKAEQESPGEAGVQVSRDESWLADSPPCKRVLQNWLKSGSVYCSGGL